MKQKLAVIGGGVAGVVASYALQDAYEVTLFEKNQYVGGHTNTIEVPTEHQGILPVDTGFIVCNDKNYPNFHRFLNVLNVPVRFADMSFGVVDENTGLEYGSRNLSTIFAQRKNIFNPKFYQLLYGVKKFWDLAAPEVGTERVKHLTLNQFLEEKNVHKQVVRDFIIPISAAIWSTPDELMLDFPASVFLNFFHNHGLLGYFNQPRWQTVIGGSYTYIKRFKELFKGVIKTNSSVKAITRTSSSVAISLEHGAQENFDTVIVATHADEGFKLLSDPSPWERETLGIWTYLPNETYLHTDQSFLPSNTRAQASWNYHREKVADVTHAPFTVTYHMNRLQGFKSDKEYCVTLNPKRAINPMNIIKKFDYTHPRYTVASVASQDRLKNQQGDRHTWFCGSYAGFGFHEDAVVSALSVAKKLGGGL